MNTRATPYELTFEERPAYLYARIKAQTIDRAMALDYLGEIADRCGAIRCKRMLLERDIPVMQNDADLFASMSDLVRMSAGIKIAFVNKHVPIDEAMRFAVGIGIGQGADYKYFNNSERAAAWLVSGLAK